MGTFLAQNLKVIKSQNLNWNTLRVYILSPCTHLPSSVQAILSDLTTGGSPEFEGTGLAQ